MELKGLKTTKIILIVSGALVGLAASLVDNKIGHKVMENEASKQAKKLIK